MNIIFLTMSYIQDFSQRSIYTDLIRKFRDEGHNMYVMSPRERRLKINTNLEVHDGINILGIKTLNIKKTNIIEKGIGQILIEYQFKKAFKKYLSNLKFDLILYSTPPITFVGVIKYIKENNPSAISYLLLKDIFPQNAVDIKILKSNSVIYKYFRNKEEKLYKISDYIGCMSPANVNYLLTHNTYIKPSKVEVNPNSIELKDKNIFFYKKEYREKYGIPLDKPVFIFGGNLGKPQGVEYLIKCLNANKNRTDCFFVVVGSGTEKQKIQDWFDTALPQSVALLDFLPKDDYDNLVKSCDVGLIFLDNRFTIPNYPSRILSYMENRMPVIAATDKCTDMGVIAENNGYGIWCESLDVDDFSHCIDKILKSDINKMGELGYSYLKANYTVDNTYSLIVNKI